MRHGFSVIAAHPHGAGGGWAPPGRALLRYPDPAREPVGFVAWLRSLCRDAAIDAVLPLDESLVALLAAIRDDLGAIVIGPDAAQYRALCDKSVLPVTCVAAAVPHPRTWIVRSEADVTVLPGRSWVVKPARGGAAAPQVVIASDRRSLTAAVRRILDSGAGAVAQERIEGRQWGVWCAMSATGVTGLAARVLETAPRAAGTPSRFAVDGDGSRIVAQAGRLLAHVGFRGVANLDVIDAGGRLFVLDVNLRPAASAGLPVRAGLDLAALAVADALGCERPLPRPFRPFRYTSAEGEVGVLAAGGTGGHRAVTAGRLVRDMARPGVMVDPSPFRDPGWYRSLIR